jgi:hypothetical protein
MSSRSTYDRRIEQLESAVIARGRRVAARRPGAPAPRAIDAAVDDLLASPHAEAGDLIRIRAVQDVDFHVRHIDRLLLALAPEQLRRADTGSLYALEIALAAVVAGDRARLERLDSTLERILDGAERPLLRDGGGTPPVLDARLRRVALHVLAVAEAARLLLGPAHDRPRAPVA